MDIKQAMKVLIVEDDKVLTLLLRTMVSKLSHSIVGCVTTGEDAISMALSQQPDVILMDILLASKMDGVDAAIFIHQKIKDIPVIFITGNTDDFYKNKASKIEYIDYLIKPVSFDELKTSLEKLG